MNMAQPVICPLATAFSSDQRVRPEAFKELPALMNIRTFSLQRAPLSIPQLKQANSYSPYDLIEVAR
jgi:hypothetical protein